MCHCVSVPPMSGTSVEVDVSGSMNIAATSFFVPSGCGWYTSDLRVVGVEDVVVVDARPVDVVLDPGEPVADRLEAGGFGDLR